MKRILSLTLALVMILGTFTGVFAAEAEVNPAEFLKEVGVLEGDDDGNLMLDNTLLRRDMVILLSRLMGVEEVAQNFPGADEILTFEDITDHNYEGYIAWSVANELIEGHDPKTFGFNENITAQDYATVLLRALSYDMSDDANWKKALETVKELGILEGVEVENKTEITRNEMAIMTYNALGVTMKDSDKTLAEFLGIEMPEEPKAKELTAEVKDTENLAEVVVELSNVDLVKNKEALLNADNYRLNNKAKVENVHLDGDNVVLSLVPYGRVEDQGKFVSLVKGEKFNLTIRNIDPAINTTYKNIVAGDNGIPVVENVEFIGTHGIKVTTSEPVANPQERNFRVGDKRTAMIIEQYGRELVLTPYHSGSFDKDATELVVEGLEDFAGYKSVKTYEDMELITDKDAPVVKAAYRSGNKLTVVFEEDIYRDSIKARENRRELGNVSFVERRVTFYADTAKKVDTNVAVYTFEREIPKDAVVLVEGVQNHSKVTMEKEEVVPTLFDDEYAPVIISDLDTSIRTEGNETKGNTTNKTKGLKVEFDKDIREFVDRNGNLVKATDIDVDRFFTLYQLDVSSRGKTDASGIKVKVAKVEKDAITLDFEGIYVNNDDRDYDYVLEVRNFSDLNGNRMEREYIDFQVLEKAIDFALKNIRVYSERHFNRDVAEIRLVFNGYVDKASAENETNYYLDGKLAIDEAIVEKDGETVTLVVYDTDKAELLKDYAVLEVSPRVRNLAKTATVKYRYWDLKTEEKIDKTIEGSEEAITYINAPVDGKIFVTDVLDSKIAIEIKPETVDNYKVYTVVGATRHEKTATVTNKYSLNDLGITATEIDKVTEDTKVEIYNNDVLVDTVVFSTKDITAPTITKAEISDYTAKKATKNVATGLTVTAKEAGVAGNSITFAITDDTTTGVAVTDTAIVVTADITNGATEADVIALVEGNAAANALVEVTSADDSVAAIAVTATSLENGSDTSNPVITLTMVDAADLDTTVAKVDVTINGKTYEATVDYSAKTLTVDKTKVDTEIKAGQVITIAGLKDENGNAVVFTGGLQ